MTRETKIGLLVGLAFIVVFAMLLSHSAPTPPPGDSLQLAKLGHPKNPNVMSDGPGGLTIMPEPAVANPAANSAITESPAPVVVQPPAASETDMASLPKPAVLEPAHADVAMTNEPAPPLVSNNVLEANMNRVAPALPEPVTPPEPTVRSGTPEASPHPSEAAPGTPPAIHNPSSKEYIVRKGDTLGQIAKNVYGTGSARVMEFLVKANKEQIKDKDKLAEGKKLVVPQLPADMFEPAPSFNVAHSDPAKAAKMDELINRRAPIEPKPEPVADKPTDSDNTKPAKETTRVYEVQAKETFSSIAREQLGSESFWRDIQKLNKGVDPTKMKPGTKIKLPGRRPLSDAAASGRSSA